MRGVWEQYIEYGVQWPDQRTLVVYIRIRVATVYIWRIFSSGKMRRIRATVHGNIYVVYMNSEHDTCTLMSLGSLCTK
jgi:hypothetical protein